jgi:preprotein translocase subunit SecG
MTVLGYIVGALNLIFAVALILAMVLHITEQETGGGGWGGWGIVGGRHILSSQSGMVTFIDRIITWIAIGWLVTAFLVAIIFRGL